MFKHILWLINRQERDTIMWRKNSIALQICGINFFFTKPKQWIKIVLKLKCSQTVYMRMNWVVNLWKYTPPPPPPYIHWKLQTLWERVKLLWLINCAFWRFQWSLRPRSVLSRACIPWCSRAADQHSEEDSESSVWWVLWIVSILQDIYFSLPQWVRLCCHAMVRILRI